MADIEASLKIDKNNLEGYFVRGLVYADLGKYEKAIKDFDKVIQMDYTFYKMSSEAFLQAKNSSDLFGKSGKFLFSLTFNSQNFVFYQKDFADFIVNFKNSFRNKENNN